MRYSNPKQAPRFLPVSLRSCVYAALRVPWGILHSKWRTRCMGRPEATPYSLALRYGVFIHDACDDLGLDNESFRKHVNRGQQLWSESLLGQHAPISVEPAIKRAQARGVRRMTCAEIRESYPELTACSICRMNRIRKEAGKVGIPVRRQVFEGITAEGGNLTYFSKLLVHGRVLFSGTAIRKHMPMLRKVLERVYGDDSFLLRSDGWTSKGQYWKLDVERMVSLSWTYNITVIDIRILRRLIEEKHTHSTINLWMHLQSLYNYKFDGVMTAPLSLDYLAKRSGMSRRAVSNSLHALESEGIHREFRKYTKGKNAFVDCNPMLRRIFDVQANVRRSESAILQHIVRTFRNPDTSTDMVGYRRYERVLRPYRENFKGYQKPEDLAPVASVLGTDPRLLYAVLSASRVPVYRFFPGKRENMVTVLMPACVCRYMNVSNTRALGDHEALLLSPGYIEAFDSSFWGEHFLGRDWESDLVKSICRRVPRRRQSVWCKISGFEDPCAFGKVPCPSSGASVGLGGPP